MDPQTIIIDGIKWYVTSLRKVEPLCPKHHLRLSLARNDFDACNLECAECNEVYEFKREFTAQKQYILDKLDSKIFKNMKFINLDDEAIPLAEVKLESKDSKYFVTGLLTESKVGLRLVLYAGEKGSDQKSQIFVEPQIKRLAFDQKDLHPNDIFTKVEATFKDGSKHTIGSPPEVEET